MTALVSQRTIHSNRSPGADRATIPEAALAVLELLPLGFLILTFGRKILAANRAARMALQRSGVIAEIDETLVMRSAAHDRKIRNLLERTPPQDRAYMAIRVPREAREPVLLLLITLGRAVAYADDSPAAVLYISDLELRQAPDPSILTEMFGFSPAECRVATLLMAGRSVNEVAGTLHVAPSTVRNHLKRLFSKTATGRQGELIHLLLCSPATLNIQRPRINHPTMD